MSNKLCIYLICSTTILSLISSFALIAVGRAIEVEYYSAFRSCNNNDLSLDFADLLSFNI